jgi:cytochrome c556
MAKRVLLISLCVVALAFGLGIGFCWAMTASDVVRTRRAVFGQMTNALKFAANHWDDSASYDGLAKAGALIQRDAKDLMILFPAGTSARDGLDTAASDAIWTDRAGFESLARQLADEAGKLAATTPSTDSAAVRKEIKTVAATCRSCHRDYRSN